MKNYQKISLLLVIMTLFSFSKEKSLKPNEKRILEIQNKYKLKRVSIINPNNAKYYETIDELVRFLENRKKTISAKATVKVRKSINKGDGTSGNAYGSYYGTGTYYASFELNQFRIDGYADQLGLSWTDAGYGVSVSLSDNGNWYPKSPNQISYYYNHLSGYSTPGTIKANGEYEETFYGGSGYFTVISKFSLDASWSSGSITVNAVIEP